MRLFVQTVTESEHISQGKSSSTPVSATNFIMKGYILITFEKFIRHKGDDMHYYLSFIKGTSFIDGVPSLSVPCIYTEKDKKNPAHFEELLRQLKENGINSLKHLYKRQYGVTGDKFIIDYKATLS